MHVTQGTFSYLPPLTDAQIRAQVQYALDNGWALSVEFSDDPHPRNFHDKAWHQSVTDEHIEKIIQYGGSAVGKSPAMPANPDLTSKPDVVAALRKKIRGFGDQQ